jgi:hypothetical protein
MKVQFQDGYAVGFKMAVGDCFRDSLAKERFNTGDIIYNDRRAYLPVWADALEHVDYAFRVVSMEAEQIRYDILTRSANRQAIINQSTISESIKEFLGKLQAGIKLDADKPSLTTKPKAKKASKKTKAKKAPAKKRKAAKTTAVQKELF